MEMRTGKITLLFCVLTLSAGCEQRHAGLTLHEAFPDSAVRQLAKAAASGKTNEIDRLIGQGVSLNSRGNYRLTPLWWSLICENFPGFSHLLSKGADPNLQFDGNYDNVLYVAAMDADSRFLAATIKAGGNVNLVCIITNNGGISSVSEGTTPLFGAIVGLNRSNVDLLITNGANINFQDRNGTTVLMFASFANDFDIAYDLLSNGADPKLKDKWGHTMMWSVKKSRVAPGSDEYQWRQKVIDLLKEKGISIENGAD